MYVNKTKVKTENGEHIEMCVVDKLTSDALFPMTCWKKDNNPALTACDRFFHPSASKSMVTTHSEAICAF